MRMNNWHAAIGSATSRPSVGRPRALRPSRSGDGGREADAIGRERIQARSRSQPGVSAPAEARGSVCRTSLTTD